MPPRWPSGTEPKLLSSIDASGSLLPVRQPRRRHRGDRDRAAIALTGTSFGVGEDLDRVKRLADLGVARVVASFPSEKAAAVLPIVDRWTAIIRHVNG